MKLMKAGYGITVKCMNLRKNMTMNILVLKINDEYSLNSKLLHGIGFPQIFNFNLLSDFSIFEERFDIYLCP